MADNIVVIGKGKLIANTTVEELTAANNHSGIFVRAKNQSKLETTLKDNKIEYTSLDGGLSVKGATTDKVGQLAFRAGVPVLELSKRSASLEQAFLELTSGAEEYKTHGGGREGAEK